MGNRKADAAEPSASAANDTAFDQLVALVLQGGFDSSPPFAAAADPTPVQRNAQLLQLMMDAVPALVSYIDSEGVYRWVNRHYGEWFGLRRDELLGRSVREVLGEERYSDAEEKLRAALQGEPVQWMRHMKHPATGEMRWLDVSYTPDLDGRGGTRGVIAMVRDVTDEMEARRVLTEHRSRLEQEVHERSAAVREAETQLGLILESTADGVFGVDASGCISFVNASACTLLGRSAEALMGRPARELLGGAVAATRALNLALSTGEATRLERVDLPRAGAAPLPACCEVRAMRREARIVGAVASFSDVTERIAAERARESALLEAKRLARLRTEFLTNMSHEIRTPLNAVLGLAEVALRGDRDRTPEDTFRMILDSGQMLLGVVNDILDFAKIEAGKMSIDLQPFELGAVIDRAVALVAPRVFAKGLHFLVDEAPGLPLRLRGDALRITQVLGNLLSNALKFTEQGGIELRVWADPQQVWVSVRDSGIGIAPGPLKRLFTPFEQADSSTTRRFGGSGLGLVISRHLLQLMGGHIQVRSTLGVGTTFSVSIPLLDAQPPEGPPRSTTIALGGAGTLSHVAEALRRQGHEVLSLTEGEALATPAHLVVLPADSLQEEILVDLALEALRLGRRVAVVTHALAAELPRPLRGRVSLLEAPLRARHVAHCLDASPLPSEPVPEEPKGRLAHLRVLAAEDNEVNALVLEAIMRMEDAQLTLVENGRLAVDRLLQAGAGHFHLVLTDIQMPEMDGYAATREMLLADPTLPVVGLTAHAMPEERERCLAAGMVDHLAKPVDVEQLVTVALRHARKRAR